jgi:hypothetical protein
MRIKRTVTTLVLAAAVSGGTAPQAVSPNVYHDMGSSVTRTNVVVDSSTTTSGATPDVYHDMG